jgi:phage terminase small subunit
MPRKSRALAAVPVAPVPREPPPRHLPADEAAEWRRVVEGLPAHWFPGASYVLLEIYCASIVNMRACRAVMMAEVEGSPRHHAAGKLYRAESAVVIKLAKLLRLGPRHDRTKLRTFSTLPKAWEPTTKSDDADGPFGWRDPAEAETNPPPDPNDPAA